MTVVEKPAFQLPERGVAIGALLVSLALIASLVVVVSTDEALATVALVIAIVAFLSQMVIAVTQFSTSAQQQQELARITGDLKSQVSAMHETTSGVATTQADQMDRLLNAILTDARRQVSSPDQRVALEEVATMARRAVEREASEARAREEFPNIVGPSRSSRPTGQPQPDGGTGAPRDLTDDFLSWLLAQKYGPTPRLGGAIYEWKDERDRYWEALIGTRVDLDSRQDVLRAISNAAPSTWASKRGALVVPAEPGFEGWRQVADETATVVVWPGTYDILRRPDNELPELPSGEHLPF